ncbi:MAG: deoxyribose-phosphate aldolase, partial [Terriglobales bacterium]
GSPVLAITVVDYPLGAATATTKLQAADDALRLGADELDMVLNLGLLKSGRAGQAQLEVAAVASLVHAAGARLKLILETALLTPDEKLRACALARAAGCDFLKTSTGTIPNGGATVEDVALLRAQAAPGMGVKAAGGIRTPALARALLAAGASRLGTTHPRALLGG